jgi:HEAT repeat protein
LLAEIEQAQQRGGSRDRARLKEFSSHSQVEVARAAMEALVKVDTSGGRQELENILRQSANAEARVAAAETLGFLEEAAPLLVSVLQSEASDEVRVGAARGLARICKSRNREALRAMVAALRDKDPEVRTWAFRALRRASGQAFFFEPKRPPHEQEDRIRLIEARLRQLGLL